MKEIPLDIINNLQDLITVHCYVYYKLDDNVISDVLFDHLCVKLTGWMNHKDFKKSKKYELFKDFSMATRYLIVKENHKKYRDIASELIRLKRYIVC